MNRWRRQLALFVVIALLATGVLMERSHSTSPVRFVLFGGFLLALLFFSTLASLRGTPSRSRFIVGQMMAFALAGLVTAAGATLWARTRPPGALPETRAAGLGPDPALGGCLTLESWSWTETAPGEAEVRAQVLPGRNGSLGLDVQATRAEVDLWGPEVARQRAPRVNVRPGERATLEQKLRRLAPGAYERLALRFSCKPEGPVGVFGVIDYVQGPTEAFEGTRDLVRPLPVAVPR